MIAVNNLSYEYRPEFLLREKSHRSNPNHLTEEKVTEYLNNFQNHIDSQIYAISRLTKVGAKNFVPKVLQAPDAPAWLPESLQPGSASKVTFEWDKFKQSQQKFLQNITQPTKEEITNKLPDRQEKYASMYKDKDPEQIKQNFTRLQEAKFGVYAGWQWEENYLDHESNRYFLVNQNNPAEKIQVFLDAQNKIHVTTTKNNMLNQTIVAMMLEIIRNAQRHSGFVSNIEVAGIPKDRKSEQDRMREKNLHRCVDAINYGIQQRKNVLHQYPNHRSSNPSYATKPVEISIQ